MTKIEWFKSELEGDGIILKDREIEDILAGRFDMIPDAIIDYVLDLENEWNAAI